MPRLSLVLALSMAALMHTAPDAHAATYNTLTGERPKIIAHRGVPAYAPENGLAGYVQSMQLGADLLEADVLATSDGKIVLMHDTTLARTTNVADVFPGREDDPVSSFTLAEIKQLNLKTVDGTGVTTEEVPTLGEFLDTVNAFNTTNNTEVGVLVEVKAGPDAGVVDTTLDVMAAKGFDTPDKGQVQAFSTADVQSMAAGDAARAADFFVAQLGLDDVVLGPPSFADPTQTLITQGFFDPDGDFVPTDLIPLGVVAGYTDAIAMFHPLLEPALIDEAHALGLEVYGWTFRFDTVSEAVSQMRPFVAAGLDGFITDQTDIARAALAAIPVPPALPLLVTGGLALAAVRRRGGAA